MSTSNIVTRVENTGNFVLAGLLLLLGYSLLG